MKCHCCGKGIGEHTKTQLCLSCWHEYNRGEKASNWRGGLTPYKIISIKGKKIPEHRYIWEQAHGPLKGGWVVHHLNGDRKDNRLENLVAIPQGKHCSAHGVLAQYGQASNLKHLEIAYKRAVN